MGISIQLSGNGKELTSAKPVNLSAGGVLCKVETGASQTIFAHRGETQVRINFPDKGHIALNGKIRRIESFGSMNSYDCAIQFTKMRENQVYRSGKRLLNPQVALETETAVVPKHNNALECFNATLNYMKIPAGEEQTNARNRVYAFFDNIVHGLPSAEQWWFFEVLDILKGQAPNCSEGLVQEYQRLYQRGFKTVEFKNYRNFSRRRSSSVSRPASDYPSPGVTRY
jgi:hypothetical protein